MNLYIEHCLKNEQRPEIIMPNQSTPLAERFARPVILGAGPVGAAIARSLVERGYRPTVITRSGTSLPGSDTRSADMSDPEAARNALADTTIVFTTVQPEYHRWQQEFPALQSSIVAACSAAAVPLMVVENLYAYGGLRAGEAMHESSPMKPPSQKGEVRLAMWRELQAESDAGRLDMAVVRSSDFFGPGVEASVFGDRFFGPLAKGKPAQTVGAVDVLHSITYVPDVGEAIVKVAEDDTSWGRAWHVPSAPAVTQNEIAQIAAASVGQNGKAKPAPAFILRLLGVFVPPIKETVEMLYEFESNFVVDSSDFTEHFGMEATPLAEALARVMEAAT